MVEHQQQKGDPRGGHRGLTAGRHMRPGARQLFSTKLARDERITQLHAVNSIKEGFNLWFIHLGLCSLTGPNPSNVTVLS